MFPRIYERNEVDFSHNGYGFLKDLIKCEVIEEDNGIFELEGQCIISSFLLEHIQEENIIKAWASEELGEQLFRIYKVQKNLDGYITFNAQHITYDLLDNFIESIEVVDVTCENALNEIFKQCAYKTPFKGYSDITHKGSMILQRVNPMEAIKGTRGSICDTFSNGPKVIKDNFNIRVNTKRGNNNNVLIAYKKNLTGFESEIDTSDLVTAIFPYATIQVEEEIIDTPKGENATSTKDKVIQLPEKYIYSEYHKNYNNLKIIPIDFSGDDVVDIESLRKKANNYFKNSNCDIPNINYKVEFIPLSKTANYADYKVLEDVNMCDMVIVRDYRFNLDVEAQVIKTIHCSLTQKLLSCELGNFKYSLSNIVGDINKNQKEIIDKVDKLKIDIDSEVGKLEINIKDEVNKLESNIELTAEKLESNFTDTTNNLQSQIVQNANSITQKVSSKDFESYKTQTDREISQKVSNGEIISSINQTAEAIKISANKLDLTGELDLQGRFKCWKSNTDKTGNYLHMDGAMMFGYNETGGSKPVFASGLWTDQNMGYFSVGYTRADVTDENGCLWISPQHDNNGGRLAFSRLVDGEVKSTNFYFQKDGAIDFITTLRGANDTDDNYTYRFDSGVSTKTLRCNNLRTHNIYPCTAGSHNIGSASMRYKDIFADSLSTTNSQLRLGTVTSTGAWQTYGALDINSKDGYIYPDKGTGQLSLGMSSMRFHILYSVNAVSVSSDKRVKTDIHYLDEPVEEINIIDSEVPRVERNINITTRDMHSFIKDDLKLASYRYNVNLERGNTSTDYGFIAQDILYTKVGSEIVQLQDKNDLNSELSYNQGNYISVIAGALQEEIKFRDNQIETLEKENKNLKSRLDNIEKILSVIE